MRKTIKDTDYLAISARIRAMETGLLTREKMEQILEARTDEEAMKLIQECGYPELRATDPEALDAVLAAVREATLADLADTAPDPRYIDIFKLKYDYHNVKAVLKADAMGTKPDHMLMDMGRISAADVKEAVRTGDWEKLPETLAAAAAEAKEVLDTTRDPQLADIVLDRWCYQEMDAVNLRTLVRTIRMGKNETFLAGILFEGGAVSVDAILKVSAAKGAGLKELYQSTAFRAAAEAGADALDGGALTAFEKLCDDAVSDYLSGAQFVPFGEAPLVAYLAARETEYTNLRILLIGRNMGLPAEVTRSRLRFSYV